MSSIKRTVMAILVILGIISILSPYSPKLEADFSNFDQVAMWDQINSAIRFFFAVSIGAIVARRNFIGPAVFLAVTVWAIVIYILYDIAHDVSDISFAQVAVEQLAGLILLIVAAILGALLGRWFYKHEIEQRSAAT